MDPLADVLDLGRVRGALLANVRAGAPWGLDIAATAGASFHALTSGIAWACVDGGEPVQLVPGDVVLFPGGAPHRISSAPDTPCRPFDRVAKERLLDPAGDLHLPGPGAETTFICAGYDYDHVAARRLMDLLPPILHIPADPVAHHQIGAVVDLLAAEVGNRAAGSRAAAARLIDLLFIGAVRWFASSAPADRPPSWLTALRDPITARALALLHERPGESWTLADLAGAVHVSRATLARRFAATVGEPPLGYLARWRMELAARRLTTSSDPVETIASEVGYRSEFAFSRAFARHHGQPPGRWRRIRLDDATRLEDAAAAPGAG